jgi:hypothetical protein
MHDDEIANYGANKNGSRALHLENDEAKKMQMEQGRASFSTERVTS